MIAAVVESGDGGFTAVSPDSAESSSAVALVTSSGGTVSVTGIRKRGAEASDPFFMDEIPFTTVCIIGGASTLMETGLEILI